MKGNNFNEFIDFRLLVVFDKFNLFEVERTKLFFLYVIVIYISFSGNTKKKTYAGIFIIKLFDLLFYFKTIICSVFDSRYVFHLLYWKFVWKV